MDRSRRGGEERPGPRLASPAVPSAHGYPRWQTAPPTLPHVERQKAVRDAQAPRDPLAADPAARRVYRLRPPASAAPVSERLRSMLDAEQLAAVEGARGRSLVLASAGYRRGSVVERLFRDVRAAEIYQGTSEAQRMIIAKNL